MAHLDLTGFPRTIGPLDTKSRFDQATFSDVTVRTQNGDLKCHRIILSMASEYFATTLEPGDEPGEDSEKTLLDLTPFGAEATKAMLPYIYGFGYGEAEDGKRRTDLTPLYHLQAYTLATKLGLKGAEDEALERLCQQLNDNTTMPQLARNPADLFEFLKLLVTHRDPSRGFGPGDRVDFPWRSKQLLFDYLPTLLDVEGFGKWVKEEWKSCTGV